MSSSLAPDRSAAKVHSVAAGVVHSARARALGSPHDRRLLRGGARARARGGPVRRRAAGAPGPGGAAERDPVREAALRRATALDPAAGGPAGCLPGPGGLGVRAAARRGVRRLHRRVGHPGRRRGGRRRRDPPRPTLPRWTRCARSRCRTIDFGYGVPDLRAFPTRDWLWALGDALKAMPTVDLGDGTAEGDAQLRAVLAGYHRRVRAGCADPADTIVVGGFRQGLTLRPRRPRRTTASSGSAWRTRVRGTTTTSRDVPACGCRPSPSTPRGSGSTRCAPAALAPCC